MHVPPQTTKLACHWCKPLVTSNWIHKKIYIFLWVCEITNSERTHLAAQCYSFCCTGWGNCYPSAHQSKLRGKRWFWTHLDTLLDILTHLTWVKKCITSLLCFISVLFLCREMGYILGEAMHSFLVPILYSCAFHLLLYLLFILLNKHTWAYGIHLTCPTLLNLLLKYFVCKQIALSCFPLPVLE